MSRGPGRDGIGHVSARSGFVGAGSSAREAEVSIALRRQHCGRCGFNQGTAGFRFRLGSMVWFQTETQFRPSTRMPNASP